MSFMAVAYVPSYLEDHANFVKERNNDLYGSGAFIISNFIIGLPYLCKFPPATSLRSLETTPNYHSPHLRNLLRNSLLALQLSAHSRSLPKLDHVAIP